jgi:hypothetical protein
MLGTRRVNGIAFDLWCGDPLEFEVDRRIQVAAAEDIDRLIREISGPTGERLHVGIEYPTHSPMFAGLVQQAIIALNDPTAPQTIRRLTLIMRELTDYKSVQAAFFAALPDFEKE